MRFKHKQTSLWVDQTDRDCVCSRGNHHVARCHADNGYWRMEAGFFNGAINTRKDAHGSSKSRDSVLAHVQFPDAVVVDIADQQVTIGIKSQTAGEIETRVLCRSVDEIIPVP